MARLAVVACMLAGCGSGTDPVGTDAMAPDAMAPAPDCITDQDCDNGLFCDGVETCDANLVCQPGAAPTLDDGVACTTDTCDEVNDVVVNTPVDSACDNTLFCDGVETCDAALGCQPGTAPTLDDGVACTTDTCDEANDLVVNAPVDSVCENNNVCDGPDTCDVVAGCVHDPPTDPTSCTDFTPPVASSMCLNSVCALNGCGDGTLDTAAGEACDDDNLQPIDGCDDLCQIETCGELATGALRTNPTGSAIVTYIPQGTPWCNCAGTHYIIHQSDGNVVMYSGAGSVVWNTGSSGGVAPGRLVLQDDGNLVLYDALNLVLWNSGSFSTNGPFRLVFGNDGNIVMRDSNNATVWQTGTSGLGDFSPAAACQ